MSASKLKGIILHTVKYGENSLVVYVYTDLAGRKTFMVRGTRNGKLPPNLHPLSLIEFESGGRRTAEMQYIKEYCPAKVLPEIASDVRKSTIALFVGELLYKLLREENAEPALFGYIFNSVCLLDELGDGVANFHLHFMVQLAKYLGFSMPGNPEADAWFDIKAGRFTALKPLHPQYFDKEDTALLSRLLNSTVTGSADMKLTGVQRHKFVSAMMDFYSFRFDCNLQLRSLSVLHEIFS